MAKWVDAGMKRHIAQLLTLWFSSFLLVGVAVTLPGETVTLIPIKDAEILQSPPYEDKANGKTYLHSGLTPTRGLRRSMLEFDVASAIPAGVTIETVIVAIPVLKNGMESTSETTGTLHLMLAAWSEGEAGFPIRLDRVESSGEGYTASPGDSTWLYAEVEAVDAATNAISAGRLWENPGGDFETLPSAMTDIGAGAFTPFDPATGSAVWESSEDNALVADVQLWLDNPEANHGWMFLGDEDPVTGYGNSRTYGCREAPEPDPLTFRRKPTLTITYTEVQDADGDVLNDEWEQVLVDLDPNDALETQEDVIALDDFNGDGISNVMAFALGYGALEWVAPVIDSRFPQVHIENDDTWISFQLPDPRPPGIAYVLEVSETLGVGAAWMEIARVEADASSWITQGTTIVFENAPVDGFVSYRVEPGADIQSLFSQFYHLRLDY